LVRFLSVGQWRKLAPCSSGLSLSLASPTTIPKIGVPNPVACLCFSLRFYVDQGIMRGCDQFVNVILEKCRERVFSMEEAIQEVPLGLYVVRGDNIAVIGQVDPDLDENLKRSNGSSVSSRLISTPLPYLVF
jgi:hypothetical protein